MYEKIERYEIKDVPGIGFEILGYWQDDLHDLRTRVVFNAHNFTIEEAEVEAVRVPFELCHEGLKTIDSIKGKDIGSGFGKMVGRLLMGKQGCYHMGELIMGSIKAVLQAASRACPEWMPEDIYRSRWVEWIDKYRDVCIYFAQPQVCQEDIQKAFEK